MMRLKYIVLFAVVPLFGAFFCTPPAFAVDTDDDIAPEQVEHITYDSAARGSESKVVESEFPAEAAEVRSALEKHIEHANTRNLDGYMDDFIADRLRYPELEREYAQRAMSLRDLRLEVRAVEFDLLTKSAATIHTRQIARYTDNTGRERVEDAVISYRWLKNGNDWRIAFTERKHLLEQ